MLSNMTVLWLYLIEQAFTFWKKMVVVISFLAFFLVFPTLINMSAFLTSQP